MAAELAMHEGEEPVQWHFWTRLSVRFGFVYTLLFFLSIAPLPPTSWVVPWIGARVFHVTAVVGRGLSDTVYDYVRTLCCLTLALIVAVAWSVLDAKRPSDSKLHEWLRFIARLILVLAMSIYGWDKVFLMQMRPPTAETLLTPVGQLSRFRLLWTLMGVSAPYQMFSGMAELLAAGLLLFRRFTTLGALVCMGAMTNVFLLNMSYEVPVKILSFHLLLLSVFLVVSDGRRLAAVFLFNRTAPPSTYRALSTRPWVNRSAAALLGIVAAAGLALNLTLHMFIVKREARTTSAVAQQPLYGTWTVNEFVESDSTPRFAGKYRWQRLIFIHPDDAEIQLGDGSIDDVDMKIDQKQATLILSDGSNTILPSLPRIWKSQFTFVVVDPHTVQLNGTIDGTAVRATLRQIDSTFPLMATPFHWTSDGG